ncbi:CAP domain-containing protein [Bombilactobacillus bombi]
MVDELNRLRAQNGLNPVVADSSLMTFSQGRADTINKIKN